jgi:aspartate/methionine/tyrosine aminotransferase
MISGAERINRINPFYVMELLARARELERQGRHVVHMEIGEPDFPTPQRVIDAGMKAIRSGDVKYTPATGLPELRSAIAGWYRKRYDVALPSDRIIITPGASGALLLALGALVNPRDEILLGDPAYPCNRNFIALFDGIPKLVSVDATTDFQLSCELIQRYWTEKTRGALIASPSNPTGTQIAPAELNAILHWIDAHSGFLLSDEIYHGLEYDERAVSALEMTDSVFVINSFSKYFGMTGWRIGWLIVPDNWIERIEKLTQNIFIAAPTHSQYAAVAAFDPDTEKEVEQRRCEFKRRRDYLYGELARLGFRIPSRPKGAFYIYADCSRFSRDSSRFANELLDEAAVAVTPGKDFGIHAAEHYLRFAYTTSLEELKEGVRRLEKFLEGR